MRNLRCNVTSGYIPHFALSLEVPSDYQGPRGMVPGGWYWFSNLYLWHTMWFHANKLLKTLKFWKSLNSLCRSGSPKAAPRFGCLFLLCFFCLHWSSAKNLDLGWGFQLPSTLLVHLEWASCGRCCRRWWSCCWPPQARCTMVRKPRLRRETNVPCLSERSHISQTW